MTDTPIPPSEPNPEGVEADCGGWISGPSIHTEEIRAVDVQPDDVLLIGGVLADVYLLQFWGRRVVIDWRERGGGSRSGVLIRSRNDILQRVTEGETQ